MLKSYLVVPRGEQWPLHPRVPKAQATLGRSWRRRAWECPFGSGPSRREWRAIQAEGAGLGVGRSQHSLRPSGTLGSTMQQDNQMRRVDFVWVLI